VEYFADKWNLLDCLVISTNAAGNCCRLAAWRETAPSRVLLGIFSLSAYFNLLYYLRAFESTGPLVAMILQIMSDIKYLVLVLTFMLLGFAQAFWLVSNADPSALFGTFDQALVQSFSFMMGNYDPAAFAGAPLENFGTLLAVLYMTMMAILLLNLLIALMGESFGTVSQKGLAQWRFEQALIISEMQGSMSTLDARREDTLYLRVYTEDLVPPAEEQDVSGRVEGLQAEVRRLRKSNDEVLRMVRGHGELGEMLRKLLAQAPDSSE